MSFGSCRVYVMYMYFDYKSVIYFMCLALCGYCDCVILCVKTEPCDVFCVK